jgi:chemotaxis protein methyltransferase CheR
MTGSRPAEVPAQEAAATARVAAELERRCGIRVHGAQRQRLDQAVARRLAELDDPGPEVYARRLEREADEWRRFIPAVTIGETLFFRDRSRWNALEREVLPGMIRHVAERPLRLWSAGCATGQEAYGLAMVCERLRDRFPDLEAEVVGSDLNPEALTVARAGVYPERGMGGLERHEVARFFEPFPGGHRVRPEVRGRVEFAELNLAEWAAAGPWPARFDLILCQRVLIYLAPAATESVLAALARSLVGGGMLVVGHSESMTPPEACVLEWTAGGSGFRKLRPRDALGFAPRPEAAPEPAPAPPPASDPGRRVAAAWDEAVAERYDAALARLGRGPLRGDALRLAAWIAVCRGAWDDARRLVARVLAEDMAHPEAHFVAGMLAAQTGVETEAVRLLKRAIYLDPGFAAAHFHLAGLEAAEGHAAAARRAWRNAAAAGAADGERVRRYCGGFEAAAFIEVCAGRAAAAKGSGG